MSTPLFLTVRRHAALAHVLVPLACCASAMASPAGAQSYNSGGSVPGWPSFIAMGAIGGPNITPPTGNSHGGNDDFGGRPVDVVFKYAGMNGNGDPGVIDPPTNAWRMTNDLTTLSQINTHPMRVAIVEYTAQMSGGFNTDDFTNGPPGQASGTPTASYLMGRHLSSLAADAQMLAAYPVRWNGESFQGSLLMNPDLLGAIQQNGYIDTVNAALPAGAVDTAIAQTLCLMTTSRSYTNHSNPNGLPSAPYLGKTYTGTPVQILQALLADTYPVWSIDSQGDAYWNIAINNQTSGSTKSQVGQWFDACVANPAYDHAKYRPPVFPAGFNGWVQANNWLIRALAPNDAVTVGWQENLWAAGSGFWPHQNLTGKQVASTYSTPVTNWLKTHAPSAMARGGATGVHFVLFDRYEMDDSAAPGAATLYNARSWDNVLTAVGQVSKNFNNLPVMLWQLPGSHLPNTKEPQPQLFQDTPGAYIFSTAPVYFFGDANLTGDLSNLFHGPAGGSTNTAVGNYQLDCGANAYHCLNAKDNYDQYLRQYKGLPGNYDWSKPHGKLALAAKKNVFAILWGGGNTTNVIKNFSNSDDHGWLAGKIQKYYTHPTPVVLP